MAKRSKPHNHDIAEEFCDHDLYIRGLVYCNQYDLFYIRRDVHYEQIQPNQMLRTVFKFITANYPDFQWTSGSISDIVQQIKWTCRRNVEDVDHDYISFNDYLLNTTTFEIEQHNQEIVSTFTVPYNYEDIWKVETPAFNKFLETSLVNNDVGFTHDEELKNLVQEMMGFYLMSTQKVSAAFFLVGSGSNGKSTLSEVIQDIIGRDYCSAMSIQTLTTDKFATHHLIGKRLNCSNEEESKYIQSDKFKALVTGEMIDAERKFGEKFEFKPRTNYLFSTNDMPSFSGMNYALRRRIKIIPFHKQFNIEKGEHDPHLAEKLQAELPGIIAWAIEGAQRIVENGYKFSKCKASDDAFEIFQSDSSSTVMFIREMFEVDEEGDSWIGHEDLYGRYRDWCQDVNRTPLAKHNFLKDINNNFDTVKTFRREVGQDRGYGKNLKFRVDDDTPPEEREERLAFNAFD